MSYLVKSLSALLIVAYSYTSCALSAFADDNPAFDEAKKSVEKSDDDPKLVPQAREQLQKIINSGTELPLAKTYLAALDCVEAKHSMWPLRSLRLINEAVATIDALAKQNPDNYELRFLQANILTKLPERFQKSKEALEARTYLKDNLEKARTTVQPQVIQRAEKLLKEYGPK